MTDGLPKIASARPSNRDRNGSRNRENKADLSIRWRPADDDREKSRGGRHKKKSSADNFFLARPVEAMYFLDHRGFVMLTRLTKEQSAMWLPMAATAVCLVSGYSFGHLA